MVFFHIFDLREDGFFYCVNPGATHTAWSINAIDDRNVTCSTFCSSNLFFLLLIFYLNLRSRFQDIADSSSLRFFFGVDLYKVFMVAELTQPYLLTFIFSQLTVHVEHALAWLAFNGIPSCKLICLIFKATHRDLEYISVNLLLEFLSTRNYWLRALGEAAKWCYFLLWVLKLLGRHFLLFFRLSLFISIGSKHIDEAAKQTGFFLRLMLKLLDLLNLIIARVIWRVEEILFLLRFYFFLLRNAPKTRKLLHLLLRLRVYLYLLLWLGA